MGLLIFYFLLAILVSFSCSLLESVILSVTPSYIESGIQKKTKSANILRHLKENIDQSLAAILTLNTIANTMGATGVGAQVTVVFGSGHIGVASAVLTFIILVFSEIVPKTLGATYWRQLAPVCSYYIQALIYFTYPFVKLSKLISRLLTKNKKHFITRDEMLASVEIGERHGTLKPGEKDVIKNLLMLSDVKVKNIMTPREAVVAFSCEQTVENVVKSRYPFNYSRIPVYKGSFNKVIGLVHKYQILEAASMGLYDTPIKTLMHKLHTVPENSSVAYAMEQMIKRKEHLFLVVGKAKRPIGIVTLEDAIETLLGVQIIDEFDVDESHVEGTETH